MFSSLWNNFISYKILLCLNSCSNRKVRGSESASNNQINVYQIEVYRSHFFKVYGNKIGEITFFKYVLQN